MLKVFIRYTLTSKKTGYFRERGKKAKIINVLCSKCDNLIFIYQKDGIGELKRCYLNRIIEPEYQKNNVPPRTKVRGLTGTCFLDDRSADHILKDAVLKRQYRHNEITDVKQLKNLVCKCSQIIGSPFIYKD